MATAIPAAVWIEQSVKKPLPVGSFAKAQTTWRLINKKLQQWLRGCRRLNFIVVLDGHRSLTLNSFTALSILPQCRCQRHEFIPDFGAHEEKTSHTVYQRIALWNHTQMWGRCMQIEVGKRAASGTESPPWKKGELTNNWRANPSRPSRL